MLYLWEAHSIVLSAQDNISSNGMVSKNLNSSKFDHILIPSVKDIPALKKEKKNFKKEKLFNACGPRPARARTWQNINSVRFSRVNQKNKLKSRTHPNPDQWVSERLSGSNKPKAQPNPTQRSHQNLQLGQTNQK